MRVQDPLLSIVVPVYNEGNLIAEFCCNLESVCKRSVEKYEIIFVDDGSRDNSFSELVRLQKKSSIKALCFSRNFGKEYAITAGLKHAGGDMVLIMDGDFQHPTEMIPDFIKYWKDGIDNVYTVRSCRKDQSFLIRCLSNLFYWLNNKISEINMPPHAGDFRLLDRCVVNVLNSLDEKQRYMKGLYAWAGFTSVAIPYIPQVRLVGGSRFRFGKLLKLAFAGITSFSNWPLRIWTIVGTIVATSSLLYALYILIETFFYGIITPGFPTLSVCLLFLGGVQLISIGVVGEYIASIFNEVKRRPHYIIKEKIGFDLSNNSNDNTR